jgi:hypothetical protein
MGNKEFGMGNVEGGIKTEDRISRMRNKNRRQRTDDRKQMTDTALSDHPICRTGYLDSRYWILDLHLRTSQNIIENQVSSIEFQLAPSTSSQRPETGSQLPGASYQRPVTWRHSIPNERSFSFHIMLLFFLSRFSNNKF